MPPAPDADLVVPTPDGLYCRAGRFHVDPWRPVAHAIVTHAHSDHACRGCERYLTSSTGVFPLRERMLPGASIDGLPFGQSLTIGDTRVSLHPAGHILGSAQIRIEHRGQVCVISGDYKTPPRSAAPDRTCEPFEPVRCNVFITESTFGLPIYRWRPQSETFADINAWWRQNQLDGRTTFVFAYALGKAQRVLAGIDPAIGPIAVHGAIVGLNRAYADAGIALPPSPHAAAALAPDLRGRALIIAPPSAAGTPWIRKFVGPDGISTALVSGWMQVRGTRRRRAIDRGFILSDHSDWDGLLWAIRETGASRVGVTHGFIEPLVRWLRERERIDAFPVPTKYEGERVEESSPDEPAAEVDPAPDDSSPDPTEPA